MSASTSASGARASPRRSSSSPPSSRGPGRSGSAPACSTCPRHIPPRWPRTRPSSTRSPSGGRDVVGIGPGGLGSDLEMFEVGQAELRPLMVQESIDIVLKLWAQDPPYEIDGRFWKFALKNGVGPEFKVGYTPRPLQQPHPPIALSIITPNSSSAKPAAAPGRDHNPRHLLARRPARARSTPPPNPSAPKRGAERGWIPISGNFFHRRYLRGHWEKYLEG